jgi:glutamate formiminotransferase
VLECVPNVSEGRDAHVLARLSLACGDALLDRHVDPDHDRSVFTLAGAHVEDSARALALAVADHVDLRDHDGAHPRLGALDVVPFVALAEDPRSRAIDAARAFAQWIGDELMVPAFLYDHADPVARSLPTVRRDAFVRRAPDFGPLTPHPALGSVAVGARAPMIAVNCELATDDVALARQLAAQIRERDGGLPGVRALGIRLASRGRVQVSMNLVALERTGLEEACTAVERLARAAGDDVTRIELVGLIPATELARSHAGFLERAGIGPEQTIELRLARREG